MVRIQLDKDTIAVVFKYDTTGRAPKTTCNIYDITSTSKDNQYTEDNLVASGTVTKNHNDPDNRVVARYASLQAALSNAKANINGKIVPVFTEKELDDIMLSYVKQVRVPDNCVPARIINKLVNRS